MMKNSRDLDQFKNVLPYASEIFGVYQPLIGWRGRRIGRRIKDGFQNDKSQIVAQMLKCISPLADLDVTAEPRSERAGATTVRIKSIQSGAIRRHLPDHESFLLDEIRQKLPSLTELTPAAWDQVIDEKAFDRLLNGDVKRRIADIQQSTEFQTVASKNSTAAEWAVIHQVSRESKIARYLLELKKTGQTGTLKEIFYGEAKNGSPRRLSWPPSPILWISSIRTKTSTASRCLRSASCISSGSIFSSSTRFSARR